MPAEPSAAAQGAGAGDGGAVLDAAVRHALAHDGFASKFRHPVRFNGTDFVETRLGDEEVLAQIATLARSTPHVFLERYGLLLSREDLNALCASSAGQTPEARFWLERLLREPPSDSELRKRGRRRRWLWARREMAQPDGFFSEDAMKHRDPAIFQRLVGRHISSESLSGAAAMQGSLSSYLMQQLDRACQEDARADARTARAARAGSGQRGVKRRAATEEGEDDLEEDEGSDAEEARVLAELGGTAGDDAVSGRERFLREMRDRFVNGLEPGFDYASIDEDSDLEDVVELGRDAEERYFDDDM